MKYYIYKKGKLLPVKRSKYDRWMKRKTKKYLLSSLRLHVGKRYYNLETFYYGAVQDGDAVNPFILYFWDQESALHPPKLNIEHLDSFDKLKEKYIEYVKLIDTRIDEFVKS